MMMTDGQRARRLFLAAVKQPPESRTAWVDDNCSNDTELKRFVQSLLNHDQLEDDPLEQGLSEELLAKVGLIDSSVGKLRVRCPSCRGAVTIIEDGRVDGISCGTCGSSFNLVEEQDASFGRSFEFQTIGHFELFERVGMGAFGSVFRARDLELDRIVAIKIPRKGDVSPKEAERFLREAKTAAQLSHPNIVSVHEVGREDETIYIVADFIDGTTLSHHLKHVSICPTDAAVLTRKIAMALQYAHERGVIHRDLKPGNILIDRDGEPYVTDFGLAKREANEVTMTMDGQVLGTPAYMSPEQARGDTESVDARADIYALGVTLFEMLTGERPFRGNLPTMMHQLLTTDAPSPHQFNPVVPSDLATICSKCLQTQPSQRYLSAALLAEDLLNYLEGRPIQARPIGAMERSWRLARRNPLVSGLAALLMIAMVLGTGASSYFAIQMNRKAVSLGKSLDEEQRLVHEKESLIKDLETSNRTVQLARNNALARSADAEAVLAFLRDKVLATTRPEGQNGGLGVTTTIRDAIDAAEPLIAESFRDQPEVEAAIRETLAKTYFDLGDYQKSIQQYQRVLRFRLDRLGGEHKQTITIKLAMIAAVNAAGDITEAVRLAEQTLEEAESSLGTDHLLALEAGNQIGRLYLDMGRIDEAARLLARVYAELEQSHGIDHDATLSALDNLAILNRRVGKIQVAIDMQQRSIDRTTKTHGPDHADVLSRMHNLAGTFEMAGRNNEAIQLNERVLALKREKLGADHPNTLTTVTNLAMSYRGASRFPEAIEMLQRVRESLIRLDGGTTRHWCQVTGELSRSLADSGRVGEAIKILEPMIKQASEKYGFDHPDVGYWMNDLASLYERQGSKEKIHSLREPMIRYELSRARSNASRNASPEHKEKLYVTLTRYGANLIAQKRYRDAEPICREGLDLCASLVPESWMHFHAMFLLGESIAGQDRYDEAETLLISAYDGVRAMKLPDYVGPDLAEQLAKINAFYRKWGRAQDEQTWSSRLAEFEQKQDEAAASREIARQLGERGRLEKAIYLYEQAEQLPDQHSSHGLARLYARSLQWSKALDTFRMAFPTKTSFQELMMLYRLGRYDEFRDRRQSLLKDYRFVSERWQYFDNLQASLLLPMEDSLKVPVRFLSAVNENQLEDAACVSMVGKAMYRLGDFSRWYRDLPADSELRKGQDLLVAIDAYRRDPTTEHRSRLENEIAHEKSAAKMLLFDNLATNSWPEYIERMAWIHEAKRVLDRTDLSFTRDGGWPDDGVNLLGIGERVHDLRERAIRHARSDEIDLAIESYEQIGELLRQPPDPSLVDLYARRGNWELALNAAKLQPGIDWRIPLLLYQLDRLDECRNVRQDLLRTKEYKTHVAHQHRHARVAILLPLEEELRAEVVKLAKANSAPTVNQQWRKILVGPLMYRLGEFDAWIQSLRPGSSFHKGTELLVALSRFEHDPTTMHRDSLEEQVRKVELQIRMLHDRGDFGKNWPDHIWRHALAKDIRAILRQFVDGHRSMLSVQ